MLPKHLLKLVEVLSARPVWRLRDVLPKANEDSLRALDSARLIELQRCDLLPLHKCAQWFSPAIIGSDAGRWDELLRLAPFSEIRLRVTEKARGELAAASVMSAPEDKPTTKPSTRRRNRSSESRPITAKQMEAAQIVAECRGDFAEAARRLGRDRKTVEQSYRAAMHKLGKSVLPKPKTLRAGADQRGQGLLADQDNRRRL